MHVLWTFPLNLSIRLNVCDISPSLPKKDVVVFSKAAEGQQLLISDLQIEIHDTTRELKISYA